MSIVGVEQFLSVLKVSFEDCSDPLALNLFADHFIGDDEKLAAWLLWLTSKHVPIDALIKTGLLHRFFQYNYNPEDVTTFYQSLESYPELMPLIEKLNHLSAVKKNERNANIKAHEKYNLRGILLEHIPPHVSVVKASFQSMTIDEANKAYRIFNTHFLITALKHYHQDEESAAFNVLKHLLNLTADSARQNLAQLFDCIDESQQHLIPKLLSCLNQKTKIIFCEANAKAAYVFTTHAPQLLVHLEPNVILNCLNHIIDKKNAYYEAYAWLSGIIAVLNQHPELPHHANLFEATITLSLRYPGFNSIFIIEHYLKDNWQKYPQICIKSSQKIRHHFIRLLENILSSPPDIAQMNEKWLGAIYNFEFLYKLCPDITDRLLQSSHTNKKLNPLFIQFYKSLPQLTEENRKNFQQGLIYLISHSHGDKQFLIYLEIFSCLCRANDEDHHQNNIAIIKAAASSHHFQLINHLMDDYIEYLDIETLKNLLHHSTITSSIQETFFEKLLTTYLHKKISSSLNHQALIVLESTLKSSQYRYASVIQSYINQIISTFINDLTDIFNQSSDLSEQFIIANRQWMQKSKMLYILKELFPRAIFNFPFKKYEFVAFYISKLSLDHDSLEQLLDSLNLFFNTNHPSQATIDWVILTLFIYSTDLTTISICQNRLNQNHPQWQWIYCTYDNTNFLTQILQQKNTMALQQLLKNCPTLIDHIEHVIDLKKHAYFLTDNILFFINHQGQINIQQQMHLIFLLAKHQAWSAVNRLVACIDDKNTYILEDLLLEAIKQQQWDTMVILSERGVLNPKEISPLIYQSLRHKKPMPFFLDQLLKASHCFLTPEDINHIAIFAIQNWHIEEIIALINHSKTGFDQNTTDALLNYLLNHHAMTSILTLLLYSPYPFIINKAIGLLSKNNQDSLVLSHLYQIKKTIDAFFSGKNTLHATKLALNCHHKHCFFSPPSPVQTLIRDCQSLSSTVDLCKAIKAFRAQHQTELDDTLQIILRLNGENNHELDFRKHSA